MNNSLSEFKVRFIPASGVNASSIRALVKIIIEDNLQQANTAKQPTPVEDFLLNVWTEAMDRLFDIAVNTAYREWKNVLDEGTADDFRKAVLLNIAKFIIGCCHEHFEADSDLDVSELVNINIRIAHCLYEQNVYQFIFNFDGKILVSGSSEHSMMQILHILENRSSAYRKLMHRQNTLTEAEILSFTGRKPPLNSLTH